MVGALRLVGEPVEPQRPVEPTELLEWRFDRLSDRRAYFGGLVRFDKLSDQSNLSDLLSKIVNRVR